MQKSTKSTDFSIALEYLSGEVREEIERIREEGAEAIKAGDWDTAKSVISFAENLERFGGNVDALMEEWGSIAQQHEMETPVVKDIVGKSFFGKAKKGSITTHEELCRPLLQALVNRWGRAKAQDAVEEVGRLMEGKLKPADFEFLGSGFKTVRWRNKVMWARNTLVNERGHMRNDSTRGIWGISEAGRKWLRESNS